MIEFRLKKIYKRIEQGESVGDAIISHGSHAFKEEIRGLYHNQTIRHYLHLDLFIFRCWIEWESEKKGFNKQITKLV